jgi:hypothetical protein
MNRDKRLLKGSPYRDAFKRWHKDLQNSLYATDMDLVLVRTRPAPEIVAVLDYKRDATDLITFSEGIAYNHLTNIGIPVYIFYGFPSTPPYERIDVKRYWGASLETKPPEVRLVNELTSVDVKKYIEWEKKIRFQ